MLSPSGVTTLWCTMMAYLSDCNRKIRWPSGLKELATPWVLCQWSVGRAILKRRHSSLHGNKSNLILWDCWYGLPWMEFSDMRVRSYYTATTLCCWESVGGNCRQSWRFVMIINVWLISKLIRKKSEKEYNPCSNVLGSNMRSTLFRK